MSTAGPGLVWRRDGVGGCLPLRGPLSRGRTILSLVECSFDVHGLDGVDGRYPADLCCCHIVFSDLVCAVARGLMSDEMTTVYVPL